MKVKIIESTSPKTFESEINKFLASIPGDLIDIKYIPVFDEEFYSERKMGSTCSYSAMIIYK